MVLTRAQAAAAAAAEATAHAEAQDTAQHYAYITAQAVTLAEDQPVPAHTAQQSDIQDDSPVGHGFNHREGDAVVPHMATTQSPVFELSPSATQHIMNIAQHFIAQTQALAEEQAMFQHHQRGENDAQNAALMAVQASTETRVQQLTEQQRAIAHQLSEALATTQNELASQFQQMQMLEGDRVMQIEKFVDKKLGEALQKVNQSSQAINSQTDVAQKLLVEIEQTVANSQAAFASHIRQVVESELANLQHDSLSAVQVQRVVDETVSAAIAEAKQTIDTELQRARSEIQREIATRMEEPVRHLVLELTTQAARQLESRVQSLVTNTQSEMNLQIQRQADATSVLREKLQKQQMRFKHRSSRIDEALLKTSIQDVLLNNPDLVSHERQEQPEQSSTDSSGDKVHGEFAEQLNATLERSIGAAATTIGNAINGGMRSITKSSLRRDEDSDSDDDIWMSPKDRQMENRMKEAWRKAYLCSKADHASSEGYLNREGKNTWVNQIDNNSEVQARNGKDSEAHISSPRIQLPFTGGAALNPSVLLVVPPTQTQIFVQKETHYGHHLQPSAILRRQSQRLEQPPQPAPRQIQPRYRHRETHPPVSPRLQSGEYRHQVQHHRKQAHTNQMQRLVNSLQQEVSARAEMAARRYSPNK
ncbi:hypothetical protein DVH05_000008 [Phytophthora capsici]|nr:hypothetical protein DVH05_000008 [Phytophthora capsici]